MLRYRRYFNLFLILLGIYFLIYVCVHFLSKGYSNKYVVNNKFHVNEIYTKDEQNEHNNYYIEITINGIKYTYQFYREIDDNNKIVKDIAYYDGDYKCMLPIFSDDIKVDFLCYKNGQFYNYQDIKEQDEQLDVFVEETTQYDAKIFQDSKKNGEEKQKITYYADNLPDDLIMTISTLKGVAIMDANISFVDLFENDIYKKDVSVFSDNYYITADYNGNQQFRDFYAVNILDGKKKIFKAPQYISFDSYIQGIVDRNMYVYDVNNEKQYMIELDNGNVTEITDKERGIKYYDGNWSYISTVRANNIVLFKNNSYESDKYQYIYKDGHKLSGFYYYFAENDNSYDVYRANVQNNNLLKYLFTVDDYDDVKFVNDYVFYKDDDSIKMYSDYTGIKTIVTTSELEFNENIDFSVVQK